MEFYFAQSNSNNPLILGFLADIYLKFRLYHHNSNSINLDSAYDTYLISITNLPCPNEAGDFSHSRPSSKNRRAMEIAPLLVPHKILTKKV
jgi:hypothetical protein